MGWQGWRAPSPRAGKLAEPFSSGPVGGLSAGRDLQKRQLIRLAVGNLRRFIETALERQIRSGISFQGKAVWENRRGAGRLLLGLAASGGVRGVSTPGAAERGSGSERENWPIKPFGQTFHGESWQ